MNAERAKAIAKAFSSTRRSLYWNDDDVTIWLEAVDGESCWKVSTSEPMFFDSTWIEYSIAKASIVYFISLARKQCVGFELERGRHML